MLLILAGVLAAGCGARPTAAATSTATLTATPDVCAPENIRAEIELVNALMREFDDASAIAANTPRDSLGPAIAELQRIRRAAQDLDVPPCLTDLKKYELAHMNVAIETLIGLMGSAEPAAVVEGVRIAGQLRDAYTLEIARLLGITVVPATAALSGSETPAAAASPAAGAFVTNTGPTTVNLRSQPNLDAPNLGVLELNQSAAVLGRSPDGQWLMIELLGQPGRNAWVFATLVSLSTPIQSVAVVTPAP